MKFEMKAGAWYTRDGAKVLILGEHVEKGTWIGIFQGPDGQWYVGCWSRDGCPTWDPSKKEMSLHQFCAFANCTGHIWPPFDPPKPKYRRYTPKEAIDLYMAGPVDVRIEDKVLRATGVNMQTGGLLINGTWHSLEWLSNHANWAKGGSSFGVFE